MTKKKGINIKQHLDDDFLDLSLCSLQEAPVKEIASVPKATKVDLSSNVLTNLGNNFASSLSHLVKLDLSSNQLTELPENFGLLVNLKHLDLYKNKLQTLPLSCSNLRSLRWLDLKENPLVPKMSQVVGTCLDQSECLAAARKVVKYLAVVQKELEEENVRKEQERLQKLMEDERKALKKGEKQKRRKNRKNAAKAAEIAKSEANQNGGTIVAPVEEEEPKVVVTKESQPKSSIFGMLGALLSSIFRVLVLTSLVVALVLFVVSILDEKAYNRSSDFIKTAASATYLKVPMLLKDRLFTFYKFAVIFSQHAVANVMFLVSHCGTTVVNWYEFFTTDEIPLAYYRTANTYLQIGYIKTSELWSSCSQKLVSLVNEMRQ